MGASQLESNDEPTFYEVIPETPSILTRQKPSKSAEQIATLELAMREHIERALIACEGQIEGRNGTAAILGINPHTLRARMRKLRINWSNYRQSAHQ